MAFPVANQRAASGKTTQITKLQAAVIRMRPNNCCVEINEMRMIPRSASRRTHAVRIMTRRTGRSLVADMFTVQRKTLVIQDARLLMTFVTKRIGVGRFIRVVRRVIISLQQKMKSGAVGPARPRSPGVGAFVIIMT